MKNGMMAIAFILTIFLVGCNEAEVPYQELSADEKSALTIKPVEDAQLTQTEARYRYRFATNCSMRPWSQFNAEFAKIAQGTRYAPKFKSASQEFAKLCAEQPQNAQAKNEWTKRTKKFAQRTDKSSFHPFLRNASLKQRNGVSRITNCRKEIQVWMKEVAQLGVNQNPNRAKRINQLYENMVRDQKRCVKTPPVDEALREQVTISGKTG